MRHDRVPTLAIVFPSREIGGAERYVHTIATAAAGRGWRVSACFPAARGTDGYRAELERIGIRTVELSIGRAHGGGWAGAAMAALREAGSTWRALTRLRATTTLLMLPHPDQSAGAVIGVALFPATSTVVAQLVPDPFTVSRSRRLLYAVARSSGQRWVAVSDDNATRLAAGLGWSDSTVDRIYNGVEDATDVGAEDRARIRAAARAMLGLPADRPILLTVARLSHQKGLDVLARAIPRVAAEFPNALWLWAGEGDRRDELSERVRAAGIGDRVLLLGHRRDVAQLLLAADLFVLPSRNEGMPFAMLEAMAGSVPVIATSLAVIREIAVDGVHARLVPVGDECALTDAMCWALAHPDDMVEMASAAAARVRERHRAIEMIDRTLAMLKPSDLGRRV